MRAQIAKTAHLFWAIIALGCVSNTRPLPAVVRVELTAEAQRAPAEAPARVASESPPRVHVAQKAASLPFEVPPALLRCDPVPSRSREVDAAHGVTDEHLTGFQAIVRGDSTVPTGPRTAIRGALSKRVIQERITQSGVFQCFESALSLWPWLEGKVEVAVLIAPDGAVVRSELSANMTGNEGLGCCLRARAMSWTFPPPEGGGGAWSFATHS
jgi:hypothetical protein